jgi:hypothetical protein
VNGRTILFEEWMGEIRQEYGRMEVGRQEVREWIEERRLAVRMWMQQRRLKVREWTEERLHEVRGGMEERRKEKKVFVRKAKRGSLWDWERKIGGGTWEMWTEERCQEVRGWMEETKVKVLEWTEEQRQEVRRLKEERKQKAWEWPEERRGVTGRKEAGNKSVKGRKEARFWDCVWKIGGGWTWGSERKKGGRKYESEGWTVSGSKGVNGRKEAERVRVT